MWRDGESEKKIRIFEKKAKSKFEKGPVLQLCAFSAGCASG
jgi:hypothetical protein